MLVLSGGLLRTVRQELTETIILVKAGKGPSFAGIVVGTGLSEAALLGQPPLPASTEKIAGKKLDLDANQVALLQSMPIRGSFFEGVPSAPPIYRFYEMMSVYGTTLKALVQEKFGDSIISVINLKQDTKKIEDLDGSHRAVITLDGKYLPTKSF